MSSEMATRGSATRGNAARSNAACPPAVICLGETMVMFAPPGPELIEYCTQFTAISGGSESNTAVGLERLGLHAGWIGKLPRNDLARRVVREIRSAGVDTSAVVWSEQGRMGTFFMEWGAKPRPTKTIYDRANSAATTLVADDLDWDYIAQAQWLHMTGITPATSQTCRISTRQILARARELGVKVSFDVNYRSLLCSKEEFRAVCLEAFPYVDLLVATEADAATVIGEHLPREQALRALRGLSACEAAVLTLGDEGAMGYDGERFYSTPGYAVQVVNRLGAGDAFDAGLLYGYREAGLQAGLDYGTAMAALKMTIPHNIGLLCKEDVENLIHRRQSDLLR